MKNEAAWKLNMENEKLIAKELGFANKALLRKELSDAHKLIARAKQLHVWKLYKAGYSVSDIADVVCSSEVLVKRLIEKAKKEEESNNE